jgi:predicted RNA-binding protein
MDQNREPHQHQHEEVLHAHPYQHDDPHHQPEALLLGVTVYALENRKEQLILDDVDLMEFDDNQIVIHNILGNEKKLTATLKRVHFVDRGKVIMLLEK